MSIPQTDVRPAEAADPSEAAPHLDERVLADPQARIEVLRGHIDSIDAAIIRLVRQRVAVSRQVGAIRAATGGPRLSLRRENQIIASFSEELGPDGAALAMLLLRTSRGRL